MPGTGRLAVLAPAPYLTVTIERATTGADEIHVHPGGQGYWVARLAAELGAEVTMCMTAGGEAGEVLAHLLGRERFGVERAGVTTNNGVYVHDRRSGDREQLADMGARPLDRHGIDDLYGIALVAAIEAGTLAMAGPTAPSLLPERFFGRLAEDARREGVTVIADLSRGPLRSALEGGLDVLKVSEEELVRDGFLAETDRLADLPQLLQVMQELHEKGAGVVILTRAAARTLVLADGSLREVVAPRASAFDPRGGGDSLTAGVAATLARAGSLLEGVRLGAAAATLNVTRHGLGSGRRTDIERLAGHVELVEIGG